MVKTICERLKRYEGQPIRIFTDDGRKFTGILLEADETTLRAIDKCGKLYFFELCHIDSIEEPQMELHRCNKFCAGEFENDNNDENCGRVGCGK